MNKPSMEPERQEKVAAYVNGEMTPEESAAFEQLMESDEALREEVQEFQHALDAAREWMTLEAPGVEHVDALEIPRVAATQEKLREIHPRQLAKPKYLSFLQYGVAAAAIFLIGFFLGTQWPLRSIPGPSGISKGLQTQEQVCPVVPSPVPSGRTVESRLADLGARRSVTQQNGRVIIETTLKGTNAPALWVVDAGFRLAQSSTQQ
jgi:anti-sigma factor RsiW